MRESHARCVRLGRSARGGSNVRSPAAVGRTMQSQTQRRRQLLPCNGQYFYLPPALTTHDVIPPHNSPLPAGPHPPIVIWPDRRAVGSASTVSYFYCIFLTISVRPIMPPISKSIRPIFAEFSAKHRVTKVLHTVIIDYSDLELRVNVNVNGV